MTTGAPVVAKIARSLLQATKHGNKVTVLNLSNSEELICNNLFCEKVGDPCICRLAKCLSYLNNVNQINLSNNKLSALPNDLWKLEKLEELDLTGNQFTELPPEIAQLTNLRILKLNENPLLNQLPISAITSMKNLKEVHVKNSAIKEENLNHINAKIFT